MGTSGLTFFVFVKSEISPPLSGVLSLIAGGFITFVVLGISEVLVNFSIKTPFLEVTSTLKEKIENVRQDLVESKREINDKLSVLNNNIQSISNRIDTVTLSMSKSESKSQSKSDARISSRINNNSGDVVKETSNAIMTALAMRAREQGFRWETISSDGELIKVSGVQEKITNVVFDMEDIVNEGVEKFSEGKFNDALIVFDLVLQRDPNNVNALNNKGNTLVNLAKYDEAFVYLKRVLTINPNFVPALINAGNVLLFQHKYQDSLNYYDRALALKSDEVVALNNKAKALIALGKREQALPYINKAIELNPSLAPIWNVKN